MKYSNKISIGTAQFGLDYGITNNKGRILFPEVLKILKIAQDNNISKIDTARSYGVAEETLGKAIHDHENFKITTKFYIDKNYLCQTEKVKEWEKIFSKSLKNLNTKKIDTLLIHNPNNIMKNQYEILFDWLFHLKEKNLINNIGVSIYKKEDLNNVNLKNIDVVQLPFSIYDQRLFLDGTIKSLYENQILIQARSIFLQGLLLQPINKWPNCLSKSFKIHHQNCQISLKELNINPIEAALSFPLKCKYLDSLIVGLSSLGDFKQILDQISKIQNNEYNDLTTNFSWSNEEDLDPRNWKL